MASTLTVFTTPAPALPCNWLVDAGCCDIWEANPTLQQAAAEYGALVVWAATGRRFGACARTVRPCRKDQENCGLINGYYWSEGTWFPYIFNGAWRNCWCGDTIGCCCTCRPHDQVWLTPPVSGIVSVQFAVSGVLAQSAYRVDDWQWLVRTDGGSWPTCNNFDKNVTGSNVSTTDDAWQVTYLWGLPVPSILQKAAGELACEWMKNCLGLPCRLPQRVSSISRQGVSVSFADIDQLLQNGLTGVTTVDQIIRQFNPYRLPSRMRIASPDIHPIRETTWP